MNTSDSQHLNLSDINTFSYKELRQKSKLSLVMGVFIICNGAIDLTLFMNQYFFVQTGYILGSLSNALVIASIYFGLHLLTEVANELELTRQVKKIETMDQIVNAVISETLGIFVKVFVFISNLSALLIFSLIMIHFFADILEEHDIMFESNAELFMKFILCICFVILSIAITAPEWLKYPITFAFVLNSVILLCCIFFNFNIALKNTKRLTQSLFNTDYVSQNISSIFFTIENTGIIIMLRDTLSFPQRIGRVNFIAYLIIFIIFTVTGSSFLMVWLLGLWRRGSERDGFRAF